MGALSINGISALRAPFEPLVPDPIHVRNTNRYHRPHHETEEDSTAFIPQDLDSASEQAGQGAGAVSPTQAVPAGAATRTPA